MECEFALNLEQIRDLGRSEERGTPTGRTGTAKLVAAAAKESWTLLQCRETSLGELQFVVKLGQFLVDLLKSAHQVA